MGKPLLERIHRLLDENSFVELYMHVNHRCNEFGMTDVDTPVKE